MGGEAIPVQDTFSTGPLFKNVHDLFHLLFRGKLGHPLRPAVASWPGALGIDGDLELYVGGREPKGVYGIPGDEPTICTMVARAIGSRP